MITIMLDFIVIGLLGAAIGYAIVLNRRLTTIQQSRAELQKFIENFTTSLLMAEASVKDLKGTGQKIVSSIAEPMQKGQILRDELTFLLERGNLLADQLETSIRGVRTLMKEKEQMSSSPLASNDTGSQFPEINPDIILSLKNIR